MQDSVLREALAMSAREAGVQVVQLEDAFTVASEYAAPQRALSCALYTVRVMQLRDELTGAGRTHELHVLNAVAQESAYAVFLAAPFAAARMSDAATTVALRRCYGLAVLKGGSTKCRTKAGQEREVCTSGARVNGIECAPERRGDAHALTCKCGGGAIHGHDRVVQAVGMATLEWGIATKMESSEFLGPNQRMDLVFPLAGRPGHLGMAVDWTRRVFGSADTLREAERNKEEKYLEAYTVPMDVYGAAYTDMGVLGQRARAVVNRLVTLGERTTGAHPDDLRLQLLAAVGAAIHNGNASTIAYFGEVNGDESLGVPNTWGLNQLGTRHALRVSGGPVTGGRGRGRPRKETAKKTGRTERVEGGGDTRVQSESASGALSSEGVSSGDGVGDESVMT